VFQQAAWLQDQGRLREAEQLLETVIKADNRHFGAIYRLGLIRLQQGKFDEGELLFRRAVRIDKGSAEAQFHLAVALTGLGQVEKALQRYEKALALKPNFPEAHNNLGYTLQLLGHHEAASARYEKALALRSDYAEAHNNLGNALQTLKRFEAAVAEYGKALTSRPDYVEARNNLGNAVAALGRHEEAIGHYQQALAIRPNYPEAHLSLGNVLGALGRHEEAIASYERALAIKPDLADAFNSRGSALRNLHRPAEALASIDKALELNPEFAEALNNRGNALRDLNRPADALASFDKALALRSAFIEALNNRGNAFRDLKLHAEASASYGRALAIDPDHTETRWHRAGLWLVTGDFERGWEEYEWRWKTQQSARRRPDFAQPLWLGEDSLAGRTILLHAEQGFGDTIQFARYVPHVAAKAARVILRVQPQLVALLSSLEGRPQIVSSSEKLPAFDCHCPLLSLPLAFKTRLETMPATVPYLHASKEHMLKWTERLPKSAAPRIGIAWAGNPAFKGDQSRSIGLPRLSPLLSAAGVEFVSIQKDLRAGDRDILRNNPHVRHLGDEINEFGDSAAIMSQLDLVISSDTAIVHLAGALGKPVWILLQYAAEWRWLLDRADSPWYPTARLFRQTRIGDWDSVLEQVQQELAKHYGPSSGGQGRPSL
jgi:tetratricopeptide (TPR) repeat protein